MHISHLITDKLEQKHTSNQNYVSHFDTRKIYHQHY